MAPKFDWNQFPAAKPDSEPSEDGGKFDWNQFPAHDEKEQEGGMLSDLAQGVSSAVRTYDSYAGAPLRKGVGALQEGKGVSEAASEAWKQVGEDPDRAPAAKQIREKAIGNISEKTILDPDSKLTQLLKKIPVTALAAHLYSRVSPNDLADFGVDAALDVTNLIPVAGMAKRGVKAGVEAADTALRGTRRVLQRSGEIAGNTGHKALAGATGTEELLNRKYLAEHANLKDVVDTRSGISNIKDEMDTTLEPLQTQTGVAKERVAVAKERRAEELKRLSDQQSEAKESLKLAQDQRLGETAARVSGDVQRLNKDVSSGSAKAYEILDQEGIRVPVTPIKSDLTKGINALKPVTDEERAAVELLKRYRESLDQFGKDMPGGEAKRIIQAIDREMKHLAPGSVERLSRDDQVLGILRRRFDAPLKESEAYANQMKGVAADTRLLKSAEDMATEGGAARALQAAQRPTGKDRADVLRLLGERQGQDYLAAVDRSTLPEYQKLKGVLNRVRAARKGAELKQAQSQLDAAISELAPFRTVAPNEFGKSGAEALIRNQLRPKTAGLDQEQLVKALDQRFGKDFSKKIDDLKVIANFDKEFTRGSANTNFWAIALGSIGTMMGGAFGGVFGTAAGAATGKLLVDKFGPQAARIILDQVVNLKKMAPVQWIDRLQVPESVKKELAKDLVVYSRVSQGTKAGVAASKVFRDANDLRKVADSDSDPNRKPAKGEAAWLSRGAAKLGLSDEQTNQLMSNPKTKKLLIEASDHPVGSPELKQIMEKIRKGLGAR
jgi:hypothetical protein